MISEQDIIDAAGEGASTDITGSSAWLVRIGEQAEGDVVSETRRDWIGDYSSVDTSVLQKVKTAVASLAAMRVVAYDRNGYISDAEQQTILDFLDYNYTKAVKLLSELDANDIRGVGD